MNRQAEELLIERSSTIAWIKNELEIVKNQIIHSRGLLHSRHLGYQLALSKVLNKLDTIEHDGVQR